MPKAFALSEVRVVPEVRWMPTPSYDYRVFYDVIDEERLVVVRHVRHKGRKSTGEIL
jgi:hypothetical protein